jgi:hypothetical protein
MIAKQPPLKLASILLAIGLFAALVFMAYLLQSKKITSRFYQPMSVEQPPAPTPFNWKEAEILSKTYGDMTIGAFLTNDLLGGTYIVAPIADGMPVTYGGGYALAFMDLALLNDKLFDVVGDKIYIINQEHSFIDVYTANLTEKFESVPQLFRMNYLYSITPKYDVGWPVSIECKADLCAMSSSFGLESGCDMQLNVTTKQYSNIQCASFDEGTFEPKLR